MSCVDVQELSRRTIDEGIEEREQGVASEPNIPRDDAAVDYLRRRAFLVIGAHAVLFALALISAFLLSYNFRFATQDGFVWFHSLYLSLLALALPVKLAVFAWTKQYRGSWRYVGLRDLFGVISASLVGTFFFLSVFFLLENLWFWRFGRPLIDTFPIPRLPQSSVFALDWACTIAFVSSARIVVRFYYEDIQPGRAASSTRVLVCGGGDAGEAVLRELLRLGGYDCVGILDDSAAVGSRIHDVEVVGRIADIREACSRFEIREVLIVLPHASPKTIRNLVESCQGLAVSFRTIPVMTDVMEGRVQVSQIREVDIDDLLGREPVRLDAVQIGRQLHGMRILVTGAGGSIGAEMCRQIASFEPQRLILFERAENNLFEVERELRAKFPGLSVVPYVGDITDRPRMHAIFAAERPIGVFHAAAHKHVPMMELNPGEAVKNNVVGTMAVADACLEFGVRKMVMISTDKAVNPTSVMGCTKRVAEMYVQGLTGCKDTQFITVRFGNVLGSSGSVVPIFRKQIAAGGPVTVTHPDMTRYFMTIPEAAQLVLQAGTMGRGGEIFMLHMGEPVRIVDLARDMITLSGLRPDVDIEIVFTGRRPGEKLFEELANEGENVGRTDHPKIGIWKHRAEDWPTVCGGIDNLIALADGGSLDDIQAQLQRIVPEYRPGEDGGDRADASALPVGTLAGR